MFLSGKNFSKKNFKKAIPALIFIFIFGLSAGILTPADNKAQASLRSRAKFFIPLCNINLEDPATGLEIPNAGVGNWPANKEFNIDVNGSRGLVLAITGVKFSSDNILDGIATGNWDPVGPSWYDWNGSSGDWDAANKTKKWKLNQEGDYEVWAQLKNSTEITSFCYDTITIVGRPPSVNTLSFTPPNSTDYCGITGYPPVRLKWKFDDPGDSQSAFQIQVFRLNNGAKVADTGKIFSSFEEYMLQNPSERLEWGTGYSWQIMVWDSADIPSVWVVGSNFTTASHAFPTPDFLCNNQEDCVSLRPSAEEVVTLTDNSTADGDAFIVSWAWDLPNQTTIVEGDTASAELKVKFSQGQEQEITLAVTDSDSFGPCSITKSINVTLPLPEWKEIPPVIWLRNFLAKISKIFE